MASVEYSIRGSSAWITINRPKQRNAMSADVMALLRDLLTTANQDPAVRVIVLTGAGNRAFSAGADLSDMGQAAAPIASHDARGALADTFRALWALEKPSIARVRGYALAGGFGLALACDFVIAASDAQFGTPEIDVGLWPYMITVSLTRSMPPRYALELMMTGRRVTAQEAERVGFVNEVVEVNDLDVAVQRLAEVLASKSPLVLRLGRRSFYRSLGMDWDTALDYLQSMLTVTVGSDDTGEGLAAFAEKRAPNWSGR